MGSISGSVAINSLLIMCLKDRALTAWLNIIVLNLYTKLHQNVT
ncbi:hypothetical protein GMES_3677 [Paraglaciecola mesophila KMM 241]|uniref:Uncharacterized protein n=1 Tax=Paraglaciecola mesophila KMM 241 TaxID=1128912 RepID=K6XZC9_9ALTE|nr:hypothetical protein GMES_3677 [Paraglaciecola mesophila KMM 241]